MCAINPVHKKRFIIDVYTSASSVSKTCFEDSAIAHLLDTEVYLNTNTAYRWHVKEVQAKTINGEADSNFTAMRR